QLPGPFPLHAYKTGPNSTEPGPKPEIFSSLLAVLVVGERLPLLGSVGIALVVGCLAVLTMPVRTTTRPGATTTGPNTTVQADAAALVGLGGTP
ncbi:hypothetical protein ACFC0I_49710, partial [Streptomyces sp. NPDC056227]